MLSPMATTQDETHLLFRESFRDFVAKEMTPHFHDWEAAGIMDREIYAIITSNIRVADQRIGDVKAQAAALMVGEDRLNALMDRYGDDEVAEAIAELRARAALQMRAFIAEIPEQTFNATA